MLLAAWHGFVLALALILPIGMQNGFLLSQGALHSRWFGALPAVITAAICDTILIGLAIAGVSAAALHIAWLKYALGSVGFLFLIILGWATWRDSAKVQHEENAYAWTPRRQMVFACSVSLLNPHALLDTLAVIGGSALLYTAWPDRLAFGVACAAVSWLWFFLLVTVGHWAGRAAARGASLALINKFSALLMWGSAFYLIYLVRAL